MHGQLAREFAEKALRLHHHAALEQTAQNVLELATCGLCGCRAGLMLTHGEAGLESAAASDPVVALADRLQAELAGPCVSGIVECDCCRIDDTATDQHWSQWSHRAADLGLRSVLCIRLESSSSTIGVLSLYDGAPHRFTDEDTTIAHVLAQHAALALSEAGAADPSHWSTADGATPVNAGR
jgi:GAF domain-containing protein